MKYLLWNIMLHYIVDYSATEMKWLFTDNTRRNDNA